MCSSWIISIHRQLVIDCCTRTRFGAHLWAPYNRTADWLDGRLLSWQPYSPIWRVHGIADHSIVRHIWARRRRFGFKTVFLFRHIWARRRGFGFKTVFLFRSVRRRRWNILLWTSFSSVVYSAGIVVDWNAMGCGQSKKLKPNGFKKGEHGTSPNNSKSAGWTFIVDCMLIPQKT